MLNKFPFKIALRYFSAKKNERLVSFISAFSLLGVTIGVAALIVVMAVMNGFHEELTDNIIGLNSDITITPRTSSIDNYIKLEKILSSQNYVTKVIPIAFGQALAIGPRNSAGTLVKGIKIEDLKNKAQVIQNITSGSFANFYGKNIIALGGELAANLGVKAGSKIKLISPNFISTAFGSMPRVKDFSVAAVFASGMYDYDAATILMPLEAAQNFLSLGETVNLVEVNTIDSQAAILYANKIYQLVGPDYRVVSWQASNQQFLSALKVERVAMFTILSLIIVVAAFNIISSLFMLVKDKTKDIAILRTIGASKSDIMLIFIINGSIIGILGTGFGVALGIGFAKNIESIRQYLEKITGTKLFEAAIYFLYNLPAKVIISDIIFISLMSLALCFLATIYPAYKAAKLNPVEALRYE